MSPADPALLRDVSASETPLRTTFRIKLNGQTVSIGTVGQAFRFITSLNAIEWMEFRALHEEALLSLQRAAADGMLTVQATNALRTLFVRARLL
jgi:delta-aminolevulinic acid dehydratase/porphobilinogen synthase